MNIDIEKVNLVVLVTNQLADEIESGKLVPGTRNLTKDGRPHCALGHLFVRCSGEQGLKHAKVGSYGNGLEPALGFRILRCDSYKEGVANTFPLAVAMDRIYEENDQQGRVVLSPNWRDDSHAKEVESTRPKRIATALRNFAQALVDFTKQETT